MLGNNAHRGEHPRFEYAGAGDFEGDLDGAAGGIDLWTNHADAAAEARVGQGLDRDSSLLAGVQLVHALLGRENFHQQRVEIGDDENFLIAAH